MKRYGWAWNKEREHKEWHEVSNVLNAGAGLIIFILFALAFGLHA